MRFLIVLTAVLGYAAASVIGPVLLANPGDAQAAAIDATVAAQDHARAFGESHARAAEAAHLVNTEAVRQVAETNRDIHENAYWNGVAHSQNVVAAAQSQAAAYSGHVAGVAPLAYGHGIVAAPYATPYAAPYAAHYAAAPYAAYSPLGYGLRAW